MVLEKVRRMSKYFFVYIRWDSYVHMINSSSEAEARKILGVLPHFRILLQTTDRKEAEERVLSERHASL